MGLIQDLIRQVLEREDVQAAAPVVDFLRPKPPLPPRDVVDVEAEVREEELHRPSSGERASKPSD